MVKKEWKEIIVVTTDNITGKKIVKTIGEVAARNNPLLGVAFAKSSADKQLKKSAYKMGANAVVGLQSQRETIRLKHSGKQQITYYLSGTAVVVEDE